MDAGNRSLGSHSLIGAGAVLSGVLLGSCYPPVDCGWLAWLALAPLGLALLSERLDRAAWCGVYVGGVVYHLMCLDWMRTAYAGDAMFGPYAAGWAVAGQAAGVVFLLVFMAARTVILRYGLPLCVGLPLFWGTLDATRRLITEGLGGAATPWFRLGVTQVDQTPIAQVADLGGEGLIGLLIAAANGLLFDLLRHAVGKGRSDQLTGWRWASPGCVAAILLASFAYGELRLSQGPIARGPIVQLMGKQEAVTDPTAADPSADLVVWPELSSNARFFTCDAPRDAEPEGVTAARNQFVQAATTRGAAVLVGCERVDYQRGNPRHYNSLVLASAGAESVEWWDKQRLVPFAERSETANEWLGLPSRCSFDRGVPRPALLLESAECLYRIGCSICYDAAFTEHSREVMRSGPIDFFVHCGSETADSRGVLQKHLLRMAQLRAIETRRPILRNSHGGHSGVIDALGRFTPVAEPGSDGLVLTDPIPLDERPSLYVAWGDVTTPLALLVCVVGWGLSGFAWNGGIRPDDAASDGEERLRRSRKRSETRGFSLLELLAVVAILGVIAALIVPRVTTGTDTAKEKVDAHNRGVINAAVERYYLIEGSWPALDLNGIGSDPDYFPDGIPTNPKNGAAYTLNATTHRVVVSGGGGGK